MPAYSSAEQVLGVQPTDPEMVWGRRKERLDRRFISRSIIIETLISRWTRPEWNAVDVSGGAGRWLSTLAPHFQDFSHLDVSGEALRTARNDHPDFRNVAFGHMDLLRPKSEQPGLAQAGWNVAFCLDTLLYRGPFVERALANLQSYVVPGGVAIIDFPMRLRASISRRIKGARYGGPERTFSRQQALALVAAAGFERLECAYQYREMPLPLCRMLAERKLTGSVPWPATWMCLALRKP